MKAWRSHVGRSAALSIALLLLVAAPAAAAAPANDDIANATTIVGATAAWSGTNVDATKEVGEPDHNYETTRRTVWYRWTAPSTGTAIVGTTPGATFVPAFAAYTGGPSFASLRRVAWNDDTVLYRTMRFRVVEGTTYNLAVAGRQDRSGPFEITLSMGTAPGNDGFANATVLSGSAPTDAVDTSGATSERKDEGLPSRARASAWWMWTAPADGSLAIDTAGSTFDTAFKVDEYSSNPDVWMVATASSTPTERARAMLRVEAGNTYRIAVDGEDEYSTGLVRIALRFREPPANDDFAEAQDLGSALAIVPGYTDGASREDEEPQEYYDDPYSTVWYSWTAPDDDVVEFRAQGHRSVPGVEVFTGDALDALSPVEAEHQGIGFARVAVEAGTTYRLRIAPVYGDVGNDFLLAVRDEGAPPNDAFAAAQPLTGAPAQANGSTLDATAEPGEPEGGGNGATAWYAWTAPGDGIAKVDFAASALDATSHVYTGTALTSLEPVAGTVLTTAGRVSREFRAVSGETYLIAVEGRGTTTGLFRFRLTLGPLPPPPIEEPDDETDEEEEEPGEDEGEPVEDEDRPPSPPGSDKPDRRRPTGPSISVADGGASTSPLPPAPVTTEAPFAVTARIPHQTRASVRRRGLRAVVRCSRRCSRQVTVTLVAGGRTLRLPSKISGTQVTARPGAAAAKLLRRVRRPVVVVRAVGRSGPVAATGVARIRLAR